MFGEQELQTFICQFSLVCSSRGGAEGIGGSGSTDQLFVTRKAECIQARAMNEVQASCLVDVKAVVRAGREVGGQQDEEYRGVRRIRGTLMTYDISVVEVQQNTLPQSTSN